MSAALAPFIVEGVLIIVAGVLGILLEKKGKPYGKVKLVLHLCFFLWFALGYYHVFIGTIAAASAVLVPVAVMGLALIVQLAIGIVMLAAKEVKPAQPTIHKISTLVMLIADVAGLILVALR